MCPHCESKYSKIVKRRFPDGKFDFMCSACGRQVEEPQEKKSLTIEEILAAMAPGSNLTGALFGDLAGEEKAPATVIGKLYRQAKIGFVDSVKLLIECGKRLKAQKENLLHGEWLSWLEKNEDDLGFGKRTAQMLMDAASRQF